MQPLRQRSDSQKDDYFGTVIQKEWIMVYRTVNPYDVQKTKLHFCKNECVSDYFTVLDYDED